jgi:DNA-directed RNA polymerase subunit RPC12/RpoP
MKNYYCNTCGKQTPHKRFFHSGSSVAAYATGGLWLLARPFYPLRCIICGNKLGDSIANAETLKKCPQCAEKIQLEAIKCRFCGHLFDHKEVSKEIKDRDLKQCPTCGKWDVYMTST